MIAFCLASWFQSNVLRFDVKSHFLLYFGVKSPSVSVSALIWVASLPERPACTPMSPATHPASFTLSHSVQIKLSAHTHISGAMKSSQNRILRCLQQKKDCHWQIFVYAIIWCVNTTFGVWAETIRWLIVEQMKVTVFANHLGDWQHVEFIF